MFLTKVRPLCQKYVTISIDTLKKPNVLNIKLVSLSYKKYKDDKTSHKFPSILLTCKNRRKSKTRTKARIYPSNCLPKPGIYLHWHIPTSLTPCQSTYYYFN